MKAYIELVSISWGILVVCFQIIVIIRWFHISRRLSLEMDLCGFNDSESVIQFSIQICVFVYLYFFLSCYTLDSQTRNNDVQTWQKIHACIPSAVPACSILCCKEVNILKTFMWMLEVIPQSCMYKETPLVQLKYAWHIHVQRPAQKQVSKPLKAGYCQLKGYLWLWCCSSPGPKLRCSLLLHWVLAAESEKQKNTEMSKKKI